MTARAAESALWELRHRVPLRAGILAGLLLLTACAGYPVAHRTLAELPPLRIESGTLAAVDVAADVPVPDLLAVDKQMRDFLERYAGGPRTQRQRLLALHQALIGAGTLGLQYDPFGEGTASEVFHRGTANCLGYANLFVALAREAGLEADYQWLEVRPQWTRLGERVVLGLHVNVRVRLRSGEEFMVDIDPPPAREVTGATAVGDAGAQALYLANLAVDALGEGDLTRAYSHTVRAIQIAPRMSHLWINLGAIYRQAGQHREAESAYLYALQLDPSAHSAMTNLVLLYQLEDRPQAAALWEQRVAAYRDANPYYHAWLGEEAQAAGDSRRALRHYDRAIELAPGDSQLLFVRGQIHYDLGQFEAAEADMEQAIESARLRSDIEFYRQVLDRVRREQVVGVVAG